MAYDNFTLDDLRRQFKLKVREQRGLFAGVKPVTISALLRQNLDELYLHEIERVIGVIVSMLVGTTGRP